LAITPKSVGALRADLAIAPKCAGAPWSVAVANGGYFDARNNSNRITPFAVIENAGSSADTKKRNDVFSRHDQN
jgi:hypothetical protein